MPGIGNSNCSGAALGARVFAFAWLKLFDREFGKRGLHGGPAKTEHGPIDADNGDGAPRDQGFDGAALQAKFRGHLVNGEQVGFGCVCGHARAALSMCAALLTSPREACPQPSFAEPVPGRVFPINIVRSLSRNELGIFAGLVERHFRVGLANQRIDPTWLLPQNAPYPWALPCIDAHASLQDAMCIVTYRNQGGGDTPPTENDVTFELESTMSEKPIQTHSLFSDNLEDIYEWGDHTLKNGQTYTGFSQFLSKIPEAGGNLPNALSVPAKGGNQAPNLLFATETYFFVACVFVKKYATPASRMPGNLLFGIGTIVPPPVGIGQFHLPSAARKRNWLKMAPRISKKGDLVRIEERTALSHTGGWKKQVYYAGQLDEE